MSSLLLLQLCKLCSIYIIIYIDYYSGSRQGYSALSYCLSIFYCHTLPLYLPIPLSVLCSTVLLSLCHIISLFYCPLSVLLSHCSYSSIVSLSYCPTILLSLYVILSHCLTVSLSSHPTVLLSLCHPIPLSYCHSVILFHCLTVSMSYYLSILLSCCHTVSLPYCILVYCHYNKLYQSMYIIHIEHNLHKYNRY